METDICIIDDSREYLESAVQLIQHHGYSALTIQDPKEALSSLRKMRPRLIMLDIMMPHLDGFSLLKKIKNNVTLHDIPVIIVSGKVFLPEKKRAKGLGAEAFLTKPVSAKDLIGEIKKYL